MRQLNYNPQKKKLAHFSTFTILFTVYKFAVEIHQWTSKQRIRHSLLTQSSPYPTNQCWHPLPGRRRHGPDQHWFGGERREFLSGDSQSVQPFFLRIVAFQWYQTYQNWTATFENIRMSLIIFFIFYKLFCPISQNKPGRHKVLFVVMRHICSCEDILLTMWKYRNIMDSIMFHDMLFS